MLARSSTAGLFAVALLALPADHAAPSYTLESTGALAVSSSGPEASFGRVPESPHGVYGRLDCTGSRRIKYSPLFRSFTYASPSFTTAPQVIGAFGMNPFGSDVE